MVIKWDTGFGLKSRFNGNAVAPGSARYVHNILISKCSQLNYDNAACLNKVMSDVTNFLFALLLNKNNSSQREKSEKNNH